MLVGLGGGCDLIRCCDRFNLGLQGLGGRRGGVGLPRRPHRDQQAGDRGRHRPGRQPGRGGVAGRVQSGRGEGGRAGRPRWEGAPSGGPSVFDNGTLPAAPASRSSPSPLPPPSFTPHPTPEPPSLPTPPAPPRRRRAAAAPPISSPANLPDSSWHHAALIDSLSPARGPCPPRPRLACPRPLGAGVRADAGGGRPHSGQDCALRGGTQSGNQGLPCPHPGGRGRAGACGRAWARACGSFRSPHARANQPRSLLWLNHPCAVQRGTYTRSRENRIWGCLAEAGVARRLGDGGPFICG